MRLSLHQLEIERGRHTKPKLYVNLRKCINCQRKAMEDDIHVTTECDKYNEIRKELYYKIYVICTGFEHLQNVDKFTYLFSSEKSPNSCLAG
jgi:hypothetical protein